jgi:hypothetical protein
MTSHQSPQPSLIQRVERAMVLLAYFIELDGDVHVPMFEKFEAELSELKKTDNVRQRARQLLAIHGRPSGLTAIPAPDIASEGKEEPPSYLGA